MFLFFYIKAIVKKNTLQLEFSHASTSLISSPIYKVFDRLILYFLLASKTSPPEVFYSYIDHSSDVDKI